MPHHIEIFTGSCGICRDAVNIVTVGKCKDCVMSVVDVDSGREEIREKIKSYNVTSVPTIIIDGKIKIVGRPSFPWFCGEEFYKFLEERYSLLIGLDRSSRSR
ncbi:MAG: thioredoxin family protein [Thaumarchaeota archaeon]|nr:thioredoxin family protein [Nitrososphaerota archaeon]